MKHEEKERGHEKRVETGVVRNGPGGNGAGREESRAVAVLLAVFAMSGRWIYGGPAGSRSGALCAMLAVLWLPFVHPLLPTDSARPFAAGRSTPAMRWLPRTDSPCSDGRRLYSSMATVLAPGLPKADLPDVLRQGVVNVHKTVAGIHEKVWAARHHLMAGAMGRCVAVSMMFPVDTVKTRLQMYGASCCSPQQWQDA